MDKINCIVIDDEPLALDLLKGYVLRTPFLQLRGQFSSGLEALDILPGLDVQLIFLDIQMPDITGLQLSKLLVGDMKIVFTTAFTEYAIDGFKVDALDYLLKPFNYEEFLKAAVKGRDWFDLKARAKDQGSGSDFLFVKSEYKQVRIELNDILYFEGLKDYVKIHLQSVPKPILSLISLKSLEEELSPSRFMRVHRSFIVALDKIQTIERGQLVINNRYITIADQYKEKFLAFLNRSSLGWLPPVAD